MKKQENYSIGEVFKHFLYLQRQSYLAPIKFWRQIHLSLKRNKEEDGGVIAKIQLKMVLLMLL